MQLRFQKLHFNEPIAMIIEMPRQKKLIGKEAQDKWVFLKGDTKSTKANLSEDDRSIS